MLDIRKKVSWISLIIGEVSARHCKGVLLLGGGVFHRGRETIIGQIILRKKTGQRKGGSCSAGPPASALCHLRMPKEGR